MADECDSEGVTDSPKRGPTLSTSTSSFEALDPHDPNLSRLATTMFQKTADYLYGELTATQDDYRLLEAMNRATIAKYSDMKQIAGNVAKTMAELNEKYKSLEPYLEQIDQIEDSVTKLEQAAYKLDVYSKRLEAKFKNLEKRPCEHQKVAVSKKHSGESKSKDQPVRSHSQYSLQPQSVRSHSQLSLQPQWLKAEKLNRTVTANATPRRPYSHRGS